MVFDRRQDQVRSDRPVVLRQAAASSARGLTYWHADARLELRGAVRGRLPADDPEERQRLGASVRRWSSSPAPPAASAGALAEAYAARAGAWPWWRAVPR